MDEAPQIQSIPEPPKPRIPRIWLLAVGVMLAGLVSLFIVSRMLAPKLPPEQVAQEPTPTPTPIRVLSAVATQSAFIAIEQSHASLSASLAATNLDDPSLSPPVLDLSLGFGL